MYSDNFFCRILMLCKCNSYYNNNLMASPNEANVGDTLMQFRFEIAVRKL